MFTKNYTKSGDTCRVTFKFRPAFEVETVHLCGDFTEWEHDSKELTRRKDGSFSATISLEAGKSYRFRYLLDQKHWENDEAADGYIPNTFGSDDSLIVV